MTSPRHVSVDTPNDPTMAEIMAAIELVYAGERYLARTRLEWIWSRMNGDSDAFHVCVLSHFMADVQDDVGQELAWDLRALGAADQLSDVRVQELHPSLTVAGFLPSLHLNVADAFFRSGDLESARKQLRICIDLKAGLSGSPFDALTRRGIESLATRLSMVCDSPLCSG